MTLDRLDRRILHELDCSARMSASEIGRRLRLGSDLVEYRIKRYTKEKIIGRFSPMIDPGQLGLTIYKTYLRHRMRGKVLRDFLKRLERHQAIYWLMEGYGEWDLVFSLGAPSPRHYQLWCDEILGWAEHLVIDTSVATLIRVTRFPKHYLVGRSDEHFEWQSAPAPPRLDTTDYRLLMALSENARQSVSQLARAVDATEAVVRYRLQQLEATGVILAYRLQFNFEQLGMLFCKVFVEIRNSPVELRRRILEYCCDEPHVTSMTEQIGAVPVEFELEVADFAALTGQIERFQELFGSDVGRIAYMIVRRDHYHRVPDLQRIFTAASLKVL